MQATRGLLWVKAGDLGEFDRVLCPTITFSEPDILLTPVLMPTKGAHPFWPGKFVFFRNDHFYSQKVTAFRALRADSWVDFLS